MYCILFIALVCCIIISVPCLFTLYPPSKICQINSTSFLLIYSMASSGEHYSQCGFTLKAHYVCSHRQSQRHLFFVEGCSQSEPQPVQRVPVTTLADGLLVPQAKFTTISPWCQFRAICIPIHGQLSGLDWEHPHEQRQLKLQ